MIGVRVGIDHRDNRFFSHVFMQEVQSMVIEVLKEKDQKDKEEEKTDKMTKPREQIKAGKLKGVIGNPGGDEEHMLKVKRPPTGYHKYSSQQEDLEDICEYLNGTKWILSEAGKKTSMTWLEMLMHFEMEGWRRSATKQGKARKLEQEITKREPEGN